MLSKLALLLQSKTALAALGVLLVGSGGTAVAVTAASGRVPFTNISMPTTHTSAPGSSGSMPDMQQTPAAQATTNAHANAVAIEGVLKATVTTTATATTTAAGTMTTAQPPITSIRVQPPGSKKAVTILVNAQTRVTGLAHTLAQLAKYRGHRVQVQADKTGTTLTAWKVTVEGMATGGTPTPSTGTAGSGTGSATGTGTAGGQNGPGGQQQDVVGTVASVRVGAASFTVRVSDATFVRVAVTSTTRFSGMVMSLSALMPGTYVEVSGTMQADGTLVATSVRAVPR